MEGFFYWLIIFGLIVLYSALLLIIYTHFWVNNKETDAILSFNESMAKIKGNFVLLLPIDEVRKRDHIRVEIQNNVEEDDSQEKQPV